MSFRKGRKYVILFFNLFKLFGRGIAKEKSKQTTEVKNGHFNNMLP